MNLDKTILIVDDDKVFQLYMKKIIEKGLELETHICNNPKEAFDWLEENIPLMITMDMEMPYMDGYSAIKKIRSDERFKQIPILACTQLANKELVVRLVNLKIIDYIQKASNTEVIYNKIAGALNKIGHNYTLSSSSKDATVPEQYDPEDEPKSEESAPEPEKDPNDPNNVDIDVEGSMDE